LLPVVLASIGYEAPPALRRLLSCIQLRAGAIPGYLARPLPKECCQYVDLQAD
jgi:hypothetical protein